MLLSMAFPNIIGMMFLSGQVKNLLQKYLRDGDNKKCKEEVMNLRTSSNTN